MSREATAIHISWLVTDLVIVNGNVEGCALFETESFQEKSLPAPFRRSRIGRVRDLPLSFMPNDTSKWFMSNNIPFLVDYRQRLDYKKCPILKPRTSLS